MVIAASPAAPPLGLQPFVWHYGETTQRRGIHVNGVEMFIALILFTVFLFLFLVCIYARLARRYGQAVWSHRSNQPSEASVQDGCRESKGVTEEIQVRAHRTLATEELECSICLAAARVGEKVKVLWPCEHKFHPECVDEWVKLKQLCPLCRVSLTPLPSDPMTIV